MARNYRLSTRTVKVVTGPGTAIFDIKPLESEQAPSGYVKKIKISVIPTDTQTNPPPGVMIYASTDPTNASQNIITAQAVHGAGTVWLTLNRKVISSSSDDSRNDSEITIWAEASVTQSYEFIAETWGRFLDTDPV